MLKKVVRRSVVMALLVVTAGAISFAKDKTENKEPQAWGMQSGNSGCVIFKESQDTTSEMAAGGGGFTTHTVDVLEVLDSIHAKLPHKKYMETEDDLSALQKLSVENHLRYVKIPKKYSPEELDKAKAMCGVQ
ncbi:MAG TPA: hypothetical protein VHX13_12755 [Acidobacteriaceae bacterium]|nr:hypothetical protein [Acidobacteriaceae bacterium]